MNDYTQLKNKLLELRSDIDFLANNWDHEDYNDVLVLVGESSVDVLLNNIKRVNNQVSLNSIVDRMIARFDILKIESPFGVQLAKNNPIVYVNYDDGTTSFTQRLNLNDFGNESWHFDIMTLRQLFAALGALDQTTPTNIVNVLLNKRTIEEAEEDDGTAETIVESVDTVEAPVEPLEEETVEVEESIEHSVEIESEALQSDVDPIPEEESEEEKPQETLSEIRARLQNEVDEKKQAIIDSRITNFKAKEVKYEELVKDIIEKISPIFEEELIDFTAVRNETVESVKLKYPAIQVVEINVHFDILFWILYTRAKLNGKNILLKEVDDYSEIGTEDFEYYTLLILKNVKAYSDILFPLMLAAVPVNYEDLVIAIKDWCDKHGLTNIGYTGREFIDLVRENFNIIAQHNFNLTFVNLVNVPLEARLPLDRWTTEHLFIKNFKPDFVEEIVYLDAPNVTSNLKAILKSHENSLPQMALVLSELTESEKFDKSSNLLYTSKQLKDCKLYISKDRNKVIFITPEYIHVYQYKNGSPTYYSTLGLDNIGTAIDHLLMLNY